MEPGRGTSVLKVSVLIVCLIFLCGCLGLTTLKPIMVYSISYPVERVDFYNSTIEHPHIKHINLTIPQNATKLFINFTFYNSENYPRYWWLFDYYNYSVEVIPPDGQDIPCVPDPNHNEALRTNGSARINMICTLNPIPLNSTLHSNNIRYVEAKEVLGFVGCGNWGFNFFARGSGIHLAVVTPYHYLNMTIVLERYLFSIKTL
jgi:hypothetical protein